LLGLCIYFLYGLWLSKDCDFMIMRLLLDYILDYAYLRDYGFMYISQYSWTYKNLTLI